MHGGLGMDGQNRRTGSCKRRNIFIWIGNHQVDVQWKFRDLFDGLDDWRTDGNVWHKVSVHHVHMEELRARFLHLADVLAQGGKIRGEDRRRDANCHWLTSRRMRSDLVRQYPAWGFC